MMGANWKRDTNQRRYFRRFAWWPVRSGTGKSIWFKNYYEQHTYYDDNGKPPIKGPSWVYVYTKNEFLMEMIKNER